MKKALSVAIAFMVGIAFAKGGFWKAVNAIQTTVDVANAVTGMSGSDATTEAPNTTATESAAPSAAPVPSAPAPAEPAPAPAEPPPAPAPTSPAVDVSAFASARTTAADTAVPEVKYGNVTFKKPATPEQIAEAKNAYLADKRKLSNARLRMEKVDEATVSAALAAFSEASSVEVKETKLSSLAPFAMLGNVTQIILNKVPCADMRPLAACAKVRTLELRYCEISDFSGLASLQALETIDLYGSNVSCSFEPLAACHKLKSINFYAVKGPQEVYDSLGTLKQVKEFHGGLTKMTSIKWLLNVPQTEALMIFAEKIDDLAPISSLANLTYFKGWSMDGGSMAPDLGDLSFLSPCRKLKTLALPSSRYTNTAIIGTFPELEEVDLSTAKQPVDVSFVKQLPKLKRIRLYGTEVVNGDAIPSSVKIYKDKKTKGL